jgi:hypothetical protein
VIDSAGRLAALASKLFSEQKRVQQQEEAAAAALAAEAAAARAGKSGRFQQSTRKSNNNNVAAEGKIGEEKKGEDTDGENNMLVGGSSILSEGHEELLSLPVEAAIAVDKITRFEVAQLQDAYHYRHDPDTPVQFREFAEVLVRLASARSRANANAAMIAAAVASAHAQSVLEAVQQRHAERAQSITTARSLSPTTPGRNKFSSASTINELNNSTVGGLSARSGGGPGSPSGASQKQVASMTYGRIRKEGPSLVSDNSHYAISHAPSSLARLSTAVDLPTAVANAALAAAAASAAAAAALGGGGPESLAYIVDLFFWERMGPYALFRQQPSNTKGHGNNHNATGTPAVSVRSSGYGRTVNIKETTASSSSERAAPTPLSSLDPLRSVCHASNVAPSLVLVALASANAAKALTRAEADLIDARHSRLGVQRAEDIYSEASKRASLLPPSSVLDNPALEHTLNAQWGRKLSEIFQSICSSRSSLSPVPPVATAALAVLSLSVPVSVNDKDSVFPTLLNGIAPSPSYGSCTIADVMSAFSNCQDLLETRPSSVSDNDVMMYMGRLVSSGSLDRVSVGDKFRFKSAANSALAVQKQALAVAAAAPPAGAKPAAAAPASPAKGSKAGSVVAAPVEPVVSEASAQKLKEEAEARSEQIRLFLAKCSAPTALRAYISDALDSTPFFGPAALLRSLYMAVRHASSPADSEKIFSLSTKPVPEPSSNEPMIAIPTASKARNYANDRDDETVMTSASAAQSSHFEAESSGQSAQPSFSVPATIIVDPSTNQTALSIDLLGLSMVKCEFFEGILRCSAALTASVVSRKAHSQSIQQALPGKALELLKLAEEEAAAFFAPPEGCDPSVAEAADEAKVAALAEIESDLDFVLRKGMSQIRYAATVGPFVPPKLTSEEQMLEDSSGRMNQSRLSTASAELFEEGSDPRQQSKGVTFDATTVPDTSAAEGSGNEGSEAPEPPVKLEKEAYVPPIDAESPAALAAAGMPIVVNKLVSGFSSSSSGGGGHTVTMHFEIFEEL